MKLKYWLVFLIIIVLISHVIVSISIFKNSTQIKVRYATEITQEEFYRCAESLGITKAELSMYTEKYIMKLMLIKLTNKK